MDKEKEIENIRNALVPIALFANVDITEAAIHLVNNGYGNVKQAVAELSTFFRLREELACLQEQRTGGSKGRDCGVAVYS